MLKTAKPIENIHPNAPRRLINAVIQAGSERMFARKCDIDHHYISQLLHAGIEPTDQTERGRDIRVMLFLPRRKRKAREIKPEEFPGQKRIKNKIRSMHKRTTMTFNEWKRR